MHSKCASRRKGRKMTKSQCRGNSDALLFYMFLQQTKRIVEEAKAKLSRAFEARDLGNGHFRPTTTHALSFLSFFTRLAQHAKRSKG